MSSPAKLATATDKNQQAAPVAKGVAMRSVTQKYGSTVAVENLTLDVDSGYCCLLGSSGCGKTTTLPMLAGHEE